MTTHFCKFEQCLHKLVIHSWIVIFASLNNDKKQYCSTCFKLFDNYTFIKLKQCLHKLVIPSRIVIFVTLSMYKFGIFMNIQLIKNGQIFDFFIKLFNELLYTEYNFILYTNRVKNSVKFYEIES